MKTVKSAISIGHQPPVDFYTAEAASLLRTAALTALAAHERKPSDAVADFHKEVITDPRKALALLLFKDEAEVRTDELAYLRSIIAEQRDAEAPGREARKQVKEGRSNTSIGSGGNPTPGQIAGSRVAREASYAAIYSSKDTTIDGRPYHSISVGEAKSLIQIKLRRIANHTAGIAKERYEIILLQEGINNARPIADTASLADNIPARRLAQAVEKAKKEIGNA